MNKKTKVLIVDDELSARENLSYLILNFCPLLDIVGTASNVDDAVQLICERKPSLVFLDVEMPQKNGFQLLKEFSEIDFKIIFITAYDKYAIKAFEVSAIDYLLKPIDVKRLVAAVNKSNTILNLENYKERLNALKSNNKKITKITIPYKNGYLFVDLNNIICIEADRMYTHIYTNTEKIYTVAKKLSYYEELFLNHQKIVRVHRSWIVNIDFYKNYTRPDKELELKNGFKVAVSKTYKNLLEDRLGII